MMDDEIVAVELRRIDAGQIDRVAIERYDRVTVRCGRDRGMRVARCGVEFELAYAGLKVGNGRSVPRSVEYEGIVAAQARQGLGAVPGDQRVGGRSAGAGHAI